MIFPRLLDPEGYAPALWDLRRDAVARDHWAHMFRLQIDDMLRILAERRGPQHHAAALPVRARMVAFLDRLDPTELERRPDAHSWTLLREQLLLEHGVEDPYREVKDDENERALPQVGPVTAAIASARTLAARLRLAVAGVLAGNLFDLGSPETAAAHRAEGSRFAERRAEVLARPWLHDDLAALGGRIAGPERPRRAVMLVDNAGPDFLLGSVPLAWLLASDGVEVLLAANQSPSLNDVTASEAGGLLARVAAADARIGALAADRRITVISTGSGSPGIDFREVSPDLAAAAAAADLLILVGQGRAIETSWNARFDLWTLRISSLKDRMVAAALGGRLYDLVCSLRAPGAGP